MCDDQGKRRSIDQVKAGTVGRGEHYHFLAAHAVVGVVLEHRQCMSKKSRTILYGKLLNEKGQDFLGIQYSTH